MHASLEDMKTLLDFPISTLQALCAVIIHKRPSYTTCKPLHVIPSLTNFEKGYFF